MVKPINAQSAPTPPVPTFVPKFIANVSYIAPTYSTNPYTGTNQTISYGHQSYGGSIVFTISNQPYLTLSNPSGSLYYNFRFKGHFETNWNYYPFFYTTYYPNGITTRSWKNSALLQYFTSSSSNSTVISINLSDLTDPVIDDQPFPNGSQVDFQVQAKIGYITAQSSPNLGVELGGNQYSFTGESSDWSNTQTLTINYSSNSTTPTTPQLQLLPFQSFQLG